MVALSQSGAKVRCCRASGTGLLEVTSLAVTQDWLQLAQQIAAC